MDAFLRTRFLIGDSAFEKLKNSKVAVFGVGGVGSFVVEALARVSIGSIDIFDYDKVDITNINRQLIALNSTVSMSKVEVMKERILNINPNAKVTCHEIMFNSSNAENYSFDNYDYVVDAIDMISSKLLIIEKAKKQGVNIISSMGMGNKIDPTKIEISDIYNTSICPLARVMRRELKSRKIKNLKVVYSKEMPIYKPKDKVNASISFVPSVAGLFIAGEIVKDIIKT